MDWQQRLADRGARCLQRLMQDDGQLGGQHRGLGGRAASTVPITLAKHGGDAPRGGPAPAAGMADAGQMAHPPTE